MCVNKMDLVSWDRGRFEEISDQVHDVIRRLGIPDLTVIPISALNGDNVARVPNTRRSTTARRCSSIWRRSTFRPTATCGGCDFPSSGWAGRVDDGSRLYMGRIDAGTLEVGDEVVVLPSGVSTTITELDTLDGDAQAAVPPMSVTFGLADRLDVGRGDVLVAPDDQPVSARELDCTLCWMSERPLHPGRRYALKHTTRTVRATVQEIIERTDPETLERQLEPTSLVVNDIGEVRLRTNSPVVADPYAVNRVTGAFILIDEDSNETVAAGVIRTARALEGARENRRDITWHPSALDRDERWVAIDQRGGTVLLTGLPASGKSTIAVELERRLVDSGQSAYLLDGDNIRHGLSEDLGFSPGDRSEHIRRVGQVARLMADCRNDRAGFADLAAGAGSRAPAQGPRGGQPAVRGGVRRHASRGMRAERSQGSLRARTRGRDQRLHRRRRSLRAARASRAPGRHLDHRRAGSRLADRRNTPKPGHGS